MSESADAYLRDIREKGDIEIPYPDCWDMGKRLRPFQMVGAAHLIVKKRFVLGDPTGAGKTVEELFSWAVVNQKRQETGEELGLWVVTTKSATRQWEGEVGKFMKGISVFRVPSENVRKTGASTKTERVAKVKEWWENRPLGVLIQNWSQFRDDWEAVKEILGDEWLSEVQIVLDEAQRIKNPNSLLGKVARGILTEVDRAHGLTATLVQNRAHDAYAVVSALCPGQIGSFLRFEKTYCEWTTKKVPRRKWGYGNVKVLVGYKHLDEFREEIKNSFLGRTDDEIEGERPDITHVTRYIDLNRKQKEVYLAAERGEFLKGDAGIGALVHARLAANNLEIWGDEGVENAKVKLFKELLEDELAGTPVIAYSPFATTINAYATELKKFDPAVITGGVGSDEREKERLRFQRGETDLILITDAGGEALNLERGKHVVFISRPWAPGTVVQVVGRARRFGSIHATVTIWFLTVTDTIDEFVDSVLNEKFDSVEEICRGRGKLLPTDQVLRKEVAAYARKRRIQQGLL